MYPLDRHEMRKNYFTAWGKFKAQQPLTPVETQLVQVVIDHPEYQTLLNQPEKYLESDFPANGDSENPYLHMGLHLALRDQIAVDTPAGISEIFEKLAKKHGDVLPAEHVMMECLAMAIWNSMQKQGDFDIANYMDSLRKL